MKAIQHVEIKRTQVNELEQINQLIAQSKSMWNYDKSYLDAALPLLKITNDWLINDEGLSLYENEKLYGFMGVETSTLHWKLEHLWIAPEKNKTWIRNSGNILFIKRS